MISRALQRLCPAILLLLVACDEPFEPLASTDLVFSIYGGLDAARDTQWVRVTPLRESTVSTPGPIDAVVTLEEIETGLRVVMNDSLGSYTGVFLDGDLYAHNFWTTMEMVPDRHYRLTATRSDGATASATVMIPRFESPTMQVRGAYVSPTNPNNNVLKDPVLGTIQGTRHLGMVLGREVVPLECPVPIRIHQEYLPVSRPAAAEGDYHDVQLSWPLSPRPPYVPFKLNCDLEPKRVLAIGSDEPWPFSPATTLLDLSHLSGFSNIEGRGIGFLAGLHTHVFPYDECAPIDRFTSCTVNFSPRSATLVGKLTNRCSGAPLDSMQVRMFSPPTNAIRTSSTDPRSGVFEFKGLEPGVAHSLTFSDFKLSLPRRPAFFPSVVTTDAIPEGTVDTVFIELTFPVLC